jgi:BirA family biotin operon repressor/biotin-[acetyl-CoA-carboxylase] ligase
VVIVGVGIDLTSKSFPAEIAAIATSVEDETGRQVAVDEIARTLTRHLSHFYDILAAENGPADLLRHWQRRSSYFSGKRVQVDLGNESIEGITDGLEENGALRVKCDSGSVTIVHAGDVKRLRANE